MDRLDRTNNKIYIGNSTNFLRENDRDPESGDKDIERIKLLFKNYLELDNVNFLFGSGSSVHLGAVSIRNFPLEIEARIKPDTDSYALLSDTVKALSEPNDSERPRESGEAIKIEFETILNYLIAKNYVQNESKDTEAKRTEKLIALIKKGLFEVCNLDNKEKEKEINKYHFHERFIKSLLQRPLNLRRANIFTLNYDLAFEYAFDNLGVHYINGFAGFHKRTFKPETFEYDFYYPGSTTSGKVQRIEKAIKYYKLHGSLSWIYSEEKDSENTFGIEEWPIPLVEQFDKQGQILIYPSAVKKRYTLDFPYSELFRRFAVSISQPQSVMFTIGYSFYDEHVNDIIFQALTNPSFTLIILSFKSSEENNSNKVIDKLKTLNDPRIIILEGPFLGDFKVFADKLMPDFYDIDTREKIATTMNKLYSGHNKSDEGSETQR
jgi:hypothetical protein